MTDRFLPELKIIHKSGFFEFCLFTFLKIFFSHTCTHTSYGMLTSHLRRLDDCDRLVNEVKMFLLEFSSWNHIAWKLSNLDILFHFCEEGCE